MDGNRPVRGLTAADFELRDDGVVQQITDVSYETLPINVISVLDLSGSVHGRAARAAEGRDAGALCRAQRRRPRGARHLFAAPDAAHNAHRRPRDAARLVNAVRPGGTTSVLDAVFAGLAMRESDPGRTLLLLFSDGIDTASWLTARDVLDSATRSDVVIYPVTVERSGSPFLGTVPSRRRHVGSTSRVRTPQLPKGGSSSRPSPTRPGDGSFSLTTSARCRRRSSTCSRSSSSVTC